MNIGGSRGGHTDTKVYQPDDNYPNLPCTAPQSRQLHVATKSRRTLTHEDTERCMRILTQTFGYPEYKGKQKEIVEAAYGGADVLVVAPTGMGKSLCFQIPAIADERGLSIVISPLLALMQNQIENLRSKNIRVASLSSQLTYHEREQVLKDLKLYDTPIKLLYVTPEGLGAPECLKMLDLVYENHNLNRLVIDEAHCISEWGHDFRADYRKLGLFRQRYADVPIMALTATATDAVQRDIIKTLAMDSDHLYQALHPFNRSNLFYEVRYLSNPDQQAQMLDIYEFITTLHNRRGKPSSGVIYCRARATCDVLSTFLRSKGLNARPYHRGVENKELQKTLKGWTEGPESGSDSVDVVVATIAFGLGIDKGDVRYIIHYNLPKSFEGFYQETGRAGRDGFPSKCVLYYSREDSIRVKRFIRASQPGAGEIDEDEGPTPTQQAAGSVQALIEFAESSKLCRHVSICRYFGEPIDETDEKISKIYCDNMCDVCKYPQKVRFRISKLSSMEEAVQNVPAFSNPTTPSVNPAARDKPGHWAARQSGDSFGGQKRSGSSDFGQAAPSAKKAKPALAPMMVTKPFDSVSSLSKPFRPPTFIGTGGSRAPSIKPTVAPAIVKSEVASPVPRMRQDTQLMPPPAVPVVKRSPSVSSVSKGKLKEEDIERAVSPDIELPDVDFNWECDYSAKVTEAQRRNGVDSLRRSFHRVLTHPFTKDEVWEKLSSSAVSSNRRNKIIFKVSSALECDVIRMSSTFDGYSRKIDSTKEYIDALSNLSLWDTDTKDFDDSQEIIQLLRQNSIREEVHD